jgi:hypothetical protein
LSSKAAGAAQHDAAAGEHVREWCSATCGCDANTPQTSVVVAAVRPDHLEGEKSLSLARHGLDLEPCTCLITGFAPTSVPQVC